MKSMFICHKNLTILSLFLFILSSCVDGSNADRKTQEEASSHLEQEGAIIDHTVNTQEKEFSVINDQSQAGNIDNNLHDDENLNAKTPSIEEGGSISPDLLPDYFEKDEDFSSNKNQEPKISEDVKSDLSVDEEGFKRKEIENREQETSNKGESITGKVSTDFIEDMKDDSFYHAENIASAEEKTENDNKHEEIKSGDDNRNVEEKTGDEDVEEKSGDEHMEEKTGDDNRNVEEKIGDDNRNVEEKIGDDNKNVEKKIGDDNIHVEEKVGDDNIHMEKKTGDEHVEEKTGDEHMEEKTGDKHVEEKTGDDNKYEVSSGEKIVNEKESFLDHSAKDVKTNDDQFSAQDVPSMNEENSDTDNRNYIDPLVVNKNDRDESTSKDHYEEKDSSSKQPSGFFSDRKIDSEMKDGSNIGSELLESAESILNQTKKDYKRAYALLAEASGLGNQNAMEKTVYSYLLGDYLPRNITKAIEYFTKLSEIGIPTGQQGLAFLYGTGTGVLTSQAKSLVYTTFAALGGDIKAQMNLGYRHWGGIGVTQSCEAALTYYQKVSAIVAKEVHPLGSTAVHRIRLYDELEQGNAGGNLDDDLLQYYQFLADKGDVQAQVGLGQLYLQGGRGVEIDHKKALQYFKQAADAGNANAQAHLGKMYYEGSSAAKQDNETAYILFSKAVEQGNPVGHSGLGLLYMHGSGVEKDYSKAMSYFSTAAEQGLPEAQLQLGNIYYHGLGVERDYQRSVKYYTMASQSGNVLAVYNLASMHASGDGVTRSCHTATELFKTVAERGKWSSLFTDAYVAYKAGDTDTALLKYYILAELGYEPAQSNVAYILEKDETTLYSKNETFARALLQWNRAASQGYTVARVKVGDYHYYGLGTELDYELAALHYRLASEQQRSAQAMFNLGYMHEQGLGLKKDIHLAKRFYDMAAESSPDAQVPVTLALAKLGAYFTIDWAKRKYVSWKYLNLRELVGNDWDLYVITFLAIVLGLLLLIRNR